MASIGLFEFIEQVKQELLTPPTDDVPLFFIGGVELELSFTAKRSFDGRLDLKLVEAGADTAREQVQRIAVKLEPLLTPDEQRKGVSSAAKAEMRRKLWRGEEEEG